MRKAKRVMKGFELLDLHERWVDALSKHFDLARKAWRETEGFEQSTFDGDDTELKYMRALMAKFDSLIGEQL